jgi:hypothetical protein
LDVDDGSGKTYLDNSLVVWTQESGEYTHVGQGIPVITAGSAGGFLKTGNYVDYRTKDIIVDGGQPVKVCGGLLYHQWLGTALQAMGVQPSEYEANGVHGYPSKRYMASEFYSGSPANVAYPDALWNAASDVLPFLKAQ